MSDEKEKEKAEIVIDGTRVVCLDHGIRGIKGCCGDNDEPVKAAADDETGFDLVKAIKANLPPSDWFTTPIMKAAEYNEAHFRRGAMLPLVLDVDAEPEVDHSYLKIVDDIGGVFDFDKVSRALTDSLEKKMSAMSVLSTERGPNWLENWLDRVDREFLYGPRGKPAEPGTEPRGLLSAIRADVADPDEQC